MSTIHQKNSNTFVMTRFERFHDPFNYIKVKGGLTSYTNIWTPCSYDQSWTWRDVWRVWWNWFLGMISLLLPPPWHVVTCWCAETFKFIWHLLHARQQHITRLQKGENLNSFEIVLVLTQLPVEIWVVQPQFGNVGGVTCSGYLS